MALAVVLISGCTKDEPSVGDVGAPTLVFEVSALNNLASALNVDMPQVDGDKLSDEVFMQISDLKEFSLSFNEAINLETVPGNITLTFVNEDDSESDVPVHVVADDKDPSKLKVQPTDISQFKSGSRYLLKVNAAVKSIHANYLDKAYQGCFVYVAKEDLDKFEKDKAYTAVISDIHMTDRRSMDKGYVWFNKNKPKLLDFLQYMVDNKQYYKELILAGDLFDEWWAPIDVETFADSNGNPLSQSEFALLIAKANEDVIEAIKKVAKEGIKVVYIPGNHDMLLETSDIDAIFGKDVVSQARDAKGLGTYQHSKYIVAEHGHRYDFWSAPDHLSNIGIEGVTKENAILPAGFFVTKYAVTSAIEQNKPNSLITFNPKDLDVTTEDQFLADSDDENKALLVVAWAVIFQQEPVSDGLNRAVKTQVSGLQRDYKISEVIPQPEQVLYKTAHRSSEWAQRSDLNKADQIPFTAALVAGAGQWAYPFIAIKSHFSKGNRIALFGHTHVPELKDYWLGADCLYANSGTWVDTNGSNPTCTFLQVYENKGRVYTTITVSLKQFIDRKTTPTDVNPPLWISTWAY